MNSQTRRMVRALSRLPGVEIRRGKHLKVYYQDRIVCTFSASPGDRRWSDNVFGDLRRAGMPESQIELIKRSM